MGFGKNFFKHSSPILATYEKGKGGGQREGERRERKGMKKRQMRANRGSLFKFQR